jgi:hypothetical protein
MSMGKKGFTASRCVLVSLTGVILLLSFLLTPIHVLSHGLRISRSFGPEVILGTRAAHANPGPSAYNCSLCRSVNLLLFDGTPCGSILRLPSAGGLSEETLAPVKAVAPLEWQSSRAPPSV